MSFLQGKKDLTQAEITALGTNIQAGTAVYNTDESRVEIWDGSAWVPQTQNSSTGTIPTKLTSAQLAAISSPVTGSLAYDTTTNEQKMYNGTRWTNVSPCVILVKDKKTAGTNGGTLTNGAWRTRDLNYISDSTKGVTLAANRITIQPGRWILEIFAPAIWCGKHAVDLYDYTNTTQIEQGPTGFSINAGTFYSHAHATLKVEINITSATEYEIRSRSDATIGAYGMGIANNYGGQEEYSSVKITKIG